MKNDTERRESSEGEPRAGRGSRATFSESCCRPEMAEMAERCPIARLARRHRVAFFAMMTTMGVVVLSIPVGAILGIIAFFRTI